MPTTAEAATSVPGQGVLVPCPPIFSGNGGGGRHTHEIDDGARRGRVLRQVLPPLKDRHAGGTSEIYWPAPAHIANGAVDSVHGILCRACAG